MKITKFYFGYIEKFDFYNCYWEFDYSGKHKSYLDRVKYGLLDHSKVPERIAELLRAELVCIPEDKTMWEENERHRST